MYLHLLALALTADPQPQRLQWKIDGVAREALAFAPTKVSPSGFPIVFVFHGHGGTMQSTAKGFAIHNHWPEAFAVYMQGLPTPSPVDPEGKRSGWQVEPVPKAIAT